MVKIKELGYRFVSKYASSNKWVGANKYKVVIREHNAAKKASWLQNLKGLTDFEFIFASNKYQLISLIRDADACFNYSVNSNLLEIGKNLKMFYIGLRGNNIELFIKDYPRINFYSIPALAAPYIAEYTIWAALNLIREMDTFCRNRLSRRWTQENIFNNQISLLKDSIIGVLGLGEVGREIVLKFKSLGAKVLGCDLNSKVNYGYLDTFYNTDDLDTMLKEINILVIALPLNNTTENLFDYKKIKLLSEGSSIINVARGEIIVEKDLVRVIKEHHIKSVVLDVVRTEPLPFYSNLWGYKNILITPHIAGNINYFTEEIQKDFIQKLKENFPNNV